MEQTLAVIGALLLVASIVTGALHAAEPKIAERWPRAENDRLWRWLDLAHFIFVVLSASSQRRGGVR